MECDTFPLTALTLLVGQQEGRLAYKKLGIGLLVITIDCNFARLIAPVGNTTSVVLSSNNIQNWLKLTQVVLENGRFTSIVPLLCEKKNFLHFSFRAVRKISQFGAKNTCFMIDDGMLVVC